MCFLRSMILPNICFRGFVCFKLQRESSLVVSCLCITTLKPRHWFISPEIKVTLIRIIQSHSFLAPTVQAAPQLYRCTVDTRCNFSMSYCLWEWDLFIRYPFYRQYSTIYLYVMFFLCQSVHLNFIVNMQTKWTICFRIYSFGLYMMAYLHTYLSSPPLPPRPQIHNMVILCSDDLDISNEGTCFTAVNIIWTCSMLMRFFGGSIAPELLVKLVYLLSSFLQFYHPGPNGTAF